jgi:hypothetical protein
VPAAGVRGGKGVTRLPLLLSALAVCLSAVALYRVETMPRVEFGASSLTFPLTQNSLPFDNMIAPQFLKPSFDPEKCEPIGGNAMACPVRASP